MSENPTSDEIDETEDPQQSGAEPPQAGSPEAIDEGGYGGPGPENETGNSGNDDDGA